MSLGNRLKQLRKEKGWSQDELAYHANVDGRQLSRYENDKVVPSVEVLLKMARAFDVSLDYLVLDDAPRRPLEAPDSPLTTKLITVDQMLSDEDRRCLLHLLDSLETKNKLKNLLSQIQ